MHRSSACTTVVQEGLTLACRLAGLPGFEDISIIVVLAQSNTLTELLCEDGLVQKGNVTLFPLLEKTGDIDQIIGGQQDEVAKIIHDMYREDQLAQGETIKSNDSLVTWGNLPESLKDANRGQADHLPIKLRAIGLSLEEAPKSPDALVFTPEQTHMLADMEHRRWVAQKKLEGWRPTSGKKDAERAVVEHSQRLIENLKLRSIASV